MVNNLRIAHLEIRSESDPDLKPYTFEKQIEVIDCSQSAAGLKHDATQFVGAAAIVHRELSATIQHFADFLLSQHVLSSNCCDSAGNNSINIVTLNTYVLDDAER